VPQNSAPRNAPTKPTVASNPACAWLSPNSRATGGSAMPNSAKSQASNITPRKQRVNRFLCQRENGRRSRRPTSSADLLSTADTDMDFPLAPRFLCAAQAGADARGEAPLAVKLNAKQNR
jgi:hypothetical protein